MSDTKMGNRVLFMNTLAFTVCFAVWMMYGVLITFMVQHELLTLDKAQIGWLIGIPVLTGSVTRLPIGILSDKYGGKPVYIGVMLFSAAACFLTSYMTTFTGLMLAGLAFGVAGASFAVGIAYTSVWFPKEKQGTALGIFGVGNAGAALTSMGAPYLLRSLTNGGENPENWTKMPQIYGVALLVMTVIFAFSVQNRRPEGGATKPMKERLKPLKEIRVWRFGLYYFLVFGGFVALAQWLVPYYLNVYMMPLATAGMMAAIFSLPSGVIRALGGWASDKFGARKTMYWVLGTCALFFLMVISPRMEITSPGEGILLSKTDTVAAVTPEAITMESGAVFNLRQKPTILKEGDEEAFILPQFQSWQEPIVKVGQVINENKTGKKKELIAKGVTRIYFQANVWVFTILVFLAGISMGIGKAAVYKHIPDYFPKDVGVVGGLVGVLGGLGGFFCPIIFGYMLKSTGVWTTCWLFLAAVSVISLLWMHRVIVQMSSQSMEGDLPASGDGETAKA